MVDDSGRLVGIVSELDLLAHDVPPDPLARISPVRPDTSPLPVVVQDVMTREVITLPPSADAALFLQHCSPTGSSASRSPTTTDLSG